MAITQNQEWPDWVKDFGHEKLTWSRFEDQYTNTFETEPVGLLASTGPIRVMTPINPFHVRDPGYVEHHQRAQAEMIRRQLEKTTPKCLDCRMVKFETERRYEPLTNRENEVLTASCGLRTCDRIRIASTKIAPLELDDCIPGEQLIFLPEVSADIPESASGEAW